MDKLDTLIESQRKRCTDMQRELDRETIKLRALEEAAALRPVGALTEADLTILNGSRLQHVEFKVMRGGRERGCISKKWRAALQDLAKRGNPYREFGALYLVANTRLNVSENAIRERVRAYAKDGLLDEHAGRYRVAELAIKKFDLDLRIEKGPTLEVEPSHLNGTAG